MEKEMKADQRLDTNQFTSPAPADAKKLPLSLPEALGAFAEDSVFTAGMGASFAQAYLKIKNAEWDSYTSHLSQWELDNTLDC
jgi:glutamine synthetase